MWQRRFPSKTHATKQTHSVSKRSEFSPNLLHVIQENEKQRKIQNCLKWGSVNVCFLLIVLIKLIITYSVAFSYFQIIEYFLSVILSINILYYIICCPGLIFKYESLEKSIEQSSKAISMSTPNNTLTSFGTSQGGSPNSFSIYRTPNSSFSGTPMNMSAASWRSTPDLNYTQYRPNMSPEEIHSTSVDNLLQPNTSGIDDINDSQSLQQYLASFQEYEKQNNSNKPPEPSKSLLNSFWNYPGAKDTTSLFKKLQYQLSFIPASKSNSISDEKGSPKISLQSLEIWKQINVDIHTLTRWTGNLRSWISKTILERMVGEIDAINEKLEQNGLADTCVGRASLESLRKNSQVHAVLQFAPTLPALVSFLEVTSNQEYLVKRLRDLSKGGSMGEFKWNGGCSFKGKEWNDSLPTDAQIIMHLFVSYLDSQLIPLPNKPDDKPFSSSHFIKCTDNIPQLTPATLAIRECSLKPPHYQVIVSDKIYEISKGYNNLFLTILLFLYHVNVRELGMLGRVNLGRSGLNILWIIQS